MAVIPSLKLARKGGLLYIKERLAHTDVSRITCTEDIRRFLAPLSCVEAFECTWAIYLDRHKSIIAFSKVAVGDSRGTFMSPELFVRMGTMLVEMAGIVTAHNHVWDPASPSAADLDSFELLRATFGIFEWDYEDNVVVSPSDFYSFKERGHFGSTRRVERRVSPASNTIQMR